MKGEKILVADDQEIVLQSFVNLVKTFGENDGHKVIGTANSVEEVEELMKGGLRPTVALVDNRFPEMGDGRAAAEIIKKLSPETIIIAFTADDVKWGNGRWQKHLSAKEFVQKLNELQH